MKRTFSRAAMLAVCAATLFAAGCKDFSLPSENQTTIAFVREFELNSDALQWNIFDHIDAPAENAEFLRIQDRITEIGILSPLVQIMSYDGPQSTVIDTMVVMIGPATGATDTLMPHTIHWKPAEDTAKPAQMMFVNIVTTEHESNLLTHAPHRIALAAHMHLTEPANHIKIRVTFPIFVNYLN